MDFNPTIVARLVSRQSIL